MTTVYYNAELTKKGGFSLELSNWGIVAECSINGTTHGRYDFDLYTDLDNVGKKGKKVTHTNISFYFSGIENRTSLDYKVCRKLAEKAPQTTEEVLTTLQAIIKEIKVSYEENGAEVQANTWTDEFTGMAAKHKVPMSAEEIKKLEDGYHPEGENIGISFFTDISRCTVFGEKESEDAQASLSENYISVDWKHRHNLFNIKEKVVEGKTLDGVAAVLTKYKIKYSVVSQIHAMYR